MQKLNAILNWIATRFNSISLARYLRLANSSNKARTVILTAAAITIASLVLLAVASLAVVMWIIRIDLSSFSAIYSVVALAILFFAARQLFKFLPRMWAACFVKVPSVQEGIVLRFGRRTGEVLEEGLHAKWPIIETVDLVDVGLKKARLDIKFPSKGNKEWLVGRAIFTYHPDLSIKVGGRSVYVEVSEENLRDIVAERISSKLAVLGQYYSSEKLLLLRPAIVDYVKCWLRLGQMPHNHSMHAKKILRYYADNRVVVKTHLDAERGQTTVHSEIEEFLGIDVEDFILPEIDFTAETIEAREEQVHIEMKARGLDTRLEKIRDLIKETGATFQEAANEVDAALDPRVTRQIISIEGKASAIVVPANLFGGTKSAGGGTDSPGYAAKGKKGGRR